MTGNIFDEAKRLVSARDAAEHYGFHPNRANFIPCPFHPEKSASLKLFNNGTWHCFGCGKGGTVVDFVMELFNLSALGALCKLNEDFNLSLPVGKPPSKAQQKAAQERQKIQKISDNYEQWRDNFISLLNSAFREGHLIMLNWPSKLTESEILAVKWHEPLEYWSDVLTYGSLDEQLEVLEDRSSIELLCKRILRVMQKESAA